MNQSAQTYAVEPHLEIQRALLRARNAGATKASVTFPKQGNHALMEDNRIGDQPYRQRFYTKIRPSDGFQWLTHQLMTQHVSPDGLHTTLRDEYAPEKFTTTVLPEINRDTHAMSVTPDGRFIVFLAEDHKEFRHQPVTVLKLDGTTQQAELTEGTGRAGYFHADSHQPGEPVRRTLFHLVTEQQDESPVSRQDLQEFLAATGRLSILALADKRGKTLGPVWPNRAVRHMHQELKENGHDYGLLPETPSISKYGNRGSAIHGHLTPVNAVAYDYDSIQADLANYALRKFKPKDLTPVQTSDPSVPILRLKSAQVHGLDGSVFTYEAEVWKGDYQSGRHDGGPVAKGHRLPHSRTERVQEIFLTMEITPPDGPAEEFTFSCDAYSDQDANQHLLLITQDSDISRLELDDIAYLHEPNHLNRTEEAAKAANDQMEDWYRKLLVDTVMWGPQQAVENALAAVAATAENLGLHRGEHRYSTPVSATSPNGSLTVTLNHQSGNVYIQK